MTYPHQSCWCRKTFIVAKSPCTKHNTHDSSIYESPLNTLGVASPQAEKSKEKDARKVVQLLMEAGSALYSSVVPKALG